MSTVKHIEESVAFEGIVIGKRFGAVKTIGGLLGIMPSAGVFEAKDVDVVFFGTAQGSKDVADKGGKAGVDGGGVGVDEDFDGRGRHNLNSKLITNNATPVIPVI